MSRLWWRRNTCLPTPSPHSSRPFSSPPPSTYLETIAPPCSPALPPHFWKNILKREREREQSEERDKKGNERIAIPQVLCIDTGENILERKARVREGGKKQQPCHPTLLLFVQTIELESREQVERCDNIRMGRMRVPQLQETNIGPIPFSYTTFQNCTFV